jgi:hypothetical protein
MRPLSTRILKTLKQCQCQTKLTNPPFKIPGKTAKNAEMFNLPGLAA